MYGVESFLQNPVLPAGTTLLLGGHHVDFVICFACSHVEVYRDDPLSGGYLIGGSVEPTLDQFFE